MMKKTTMVSENLSIAAEQEELHVPVVFHKMSAEAVADLPFDESWTVLGSRSLIVGTKIWSLKMS